MVYYEGKFYLVVELQFTIVYYGLLWTKLLPRGRFAVISEYTVAYYERKFCMMVLLQFTAVYHGLLRKKVYLVIELKFIRVYYSKLWRRVLLHCRIEVYLIIYFVVWRKILYHGLISVYQGIWWQNFTPWYYCSLPHGLLWRKYTIIMLIYDIQYVMKNENYDVMIVLMDITILFIQYHI